MKILIDILNNKEERVLLVEQFQEYIWNGSPSFENTEIEDILRDLAHDLDYYQPNRELRNQDISYYGDEKLEQELKSAIAKLKKNIGA